jgi:hypothetical protein
VLTYISVSYDKIKKLCLFTRRKGQHNNNHKKYLKTKSCSIFLGFSKYYNNEEIEITARGIYSHRPISVIYQLLLSIDGGGIQMSTHQQTAVRKL